MNTRKFHTNDKDYRFDLDKFIEIVESKARENNTNLKKIEMELANTLEGVSYSTVHSWTMKKNGPSDLDRIYKIEIFLGLEKGQLLTECVRNEKEEIIEEIQKRIPEFKIIGFSLGKDSENRYTPQIDPDIDLWAFRRFNFVNNDPNNLVTLYFVKKLLHSRILDNIDYNQFNELIIDYEATDSLTNEYKLIIMQSLLISETIRLNNVLFGTEYNAGGCSLFLSTCFEDGKIYLRLNKDINNHQLIKMLKRIEEEKQEKYIQARNYFNAHNNKFEYICGFDNKNNYKIKMLYDGHSPQLEVVEAKSKHEAQILFLERYIDQLLQYFMESNFLKLFSRDFYCGNLDKFVKTNFANDVKILSFVESLHDRFRFKMNKKNKDIEKNCIKQISGYLKGIELSKVLNMDFYKSFWMYHMIDSVNVSLSVDVRNHINNYIGLGENL